MDKEEIKTIGAVRADLEKIVKWHDTDERVNGLTTTICKFCSSRLRQLTE